MKVKRGDIVKVVNDECYNEKRTQKAIILEYLETSENVEIYESLIGLEKIIIYYAHNDRFYYYAKLNKKEYFGEWILITH